jgi:hypothetical protein
MENNTSHHILNTSSNLLGLCFIVLTALKIQNLGAKSMIDELTAIASLLFMVSSILSFLSIRSTTSRGPKYEKIAEYLFIIGLLAMFILTIIVSIDFIF